MDEEETPVTTPLVLGGTERAGGWLSSVDWQVCGGETKCSETGQRRGEKRGKDEQGEIEGKGNCVV